MTGRTLSLAVVTTGGLFVAAGAALLVGLLFGVWLGTAAGALALGAGLVLGGLFLVDVG